MDDTPRKYETQDLYLAAFLHAHGIKLVEVEHEGRRAFFVFGTPEKCKELVLKYYNGDASCNAREFARSLQELKAAIVNV